MEVDDRAPQVIALPPQLILPLEVIGPQTIACVPQAIVPVREVIDPFAWRSLFTCKPSAQNVGFSSVMSPNESRVMEQLVPSADKRRTSLTSSDMPESVPPVKVYSGTTLLRGASILFHVILLNVPTLSQEAAPHVIA